MSICEKIEVGRFQSWMKGVLQFARSSIFRKTLLPWLFILPILLVHLAIVIIPTLVGLYYSLTDWSGIGDATFIGLENFHKLFTDDMNFRNALSHNLLWMVFFLTVPFMMALFVAHIVSQVKRGMMLWRTLFFLPYILPSVVGAHIWRNILHPRFGVGAQLTKLGIPGMDVAWLGNSKTALGAIMIASNWVYWGFLMTLFLSAMQAISVDLYDAARIDGANKWQEFLHVTLPGIRPTLIFMLIMSAIWSFKGFDYAWILTQGGPGGASELLATYIYKQAFKRFEMGYATAIGLTVTVISSMIVWLFAILRRRGWEI